MTLAQALPTAVVLAAGLLHAAWNTLAKAARDRDAGLTLISVTKTVLCLPLLPLFALPAPASLPYLLASSAVHAVYMAQLSRAYRLGDFGQVYPVARGVAPIGVAAVAVALLGERLGPVQLAGLLAVCGGLAVLSLGGLPGRGVGGPAVRAALATGATIAAYTLIDAVGVRRSGSAFGYTAWMAALEGVLVALLMPRLRKRPLTDLLRPDRTRSAVGGLVAALSYGAVLWAQTRSPTSEVAALRETGIIWAAVIGAVFFHEPLGRRRICAGAVVVFGVVLLGAAH
ncbi:EamA family transporter [Streptomyces sp. NPDC057682]|uniref:EamA family transporter n=1 Tax=Streptomyces sp. NPDC057682 TaxID=3346210 RepID=UPI0036AB0246